MRKWWKNTAATMRSVGTADRFLILFLVLLFAYTGHHLFYGAAAVQDTSAVDIIVRTSTASIFGYFLSGSLGPPDHTERLDLPEPPSAPPAGETGAAAESGQPQGRIGFSGAPSRPLEGTGGIRFSREQPSTPPDCGRFGVTVVALAGLASLGMLLAARPFFQDTPEMIAIVSQLRDFVSASIGFLISCGKQKR